MQSEQLKKTSNAYALDCQISGVNFLLSRISSLVPERDLIKVKKQ